MELGLFYLGVCFGAWAIGWCAGTLFRVITQISETAT